MILVMLLISRPSFHHHYILTAPETPIAVTVKAVNNIGNGKPDSVTFFTKEGGLYVYICTSRMYFQSITEYAKFQSYCIAAVLVSNFVCEPSPISCEIDIIPRSESCVVRT